jgi:hypothetical protein
MTAAFAPPDKIKLPATMLVGLLACVATSAGTLALAQKRISDMETKLEAVEQARAEDRELLVRIDERTAEMKRILQGPRP